LVRSDHTATNPADGDIAISDVRFFKNDTMLVASGEDGTVRLWSVAKLEQRQILTGHIGGISHLAVTANDNLLATAGRDGTVRLWDLNTDEPLVVWPAHDGEVNSVAFTPDGRGIITAGDDSTARRYWIGDSPEYLINEAQRQLPREIQMTDQP
jgi:WD40 repeat protein